MRLLDLISQGHCATVRAEDGTVLPAAGDSLWVEWADAPRQEILRGVPSLNTGSDPAVGRAGVLLLCASDCRSGTMRTFWSGRDERACLSPVTTSFDFDGEPMPVGGADWRGVRACITFAATWCAGDLRYSGARPTCAAAEGSGRSVAGLWSLALATTRRLLGAAEPRRFR